MRSCIPHQPYRASFGDPEGRPIQRTSGDPYWREGQVRVDSSKSEEDVQLFFMGTTEGCSGNPLQWEMGESGVWSSFGAHGDHKTFPAPRPLSQKEPSPRRRLGPLRHRRRRLPAGALGRRPLGGKPHPLPPREGLRHLREEQPRAGGRGLVAVFHPPPGGGGDFS